MSDLGFLFQKPQAQGMGAGYEAGMEDYFRARQQQSNDKMADYQASMAEKNRAMLPYEVEKAQYDQGAGRAMSEQKHQMEMSKAILELEKMSDEQFARKLDMQDQAMLGFWGNAQAYLNQGIPTAQVIDQLGQQLPENKRQQFVQGLQQYRNMPPQQASQEVQKIMQTISQQRVNRDPAYIKQMALEKLKGQFDLQRAGVQASASGAKTSNLSSLGKDALAIAQMRGRNTPTDQDWQDAAAYNQAKSPAMAPAEEVRGKRYVDTGTGAVYPNRASIPEDRLGFVRREETKATSKTAPQGQKQRFKYVNGQLVPVE